MSSFMKRRDVFTKVRTTLKELFLKNRKEHIINKINNFLSDKLIDEIDVFRSLSLLQRVNVLFLTLIMKKQISLTLKKMNIKLNNIERNTAKIIIILTTYVVATKTSTQREINATTTTITIASYNNIYQRKQLKKVKKKKTMIYKIKKQRKKKNLRILFVKESMKRLQCVEKMKKNVVTTRRLFNENIELMTRSKKIKNWLIFDNSLLKHVTSSTYVVSKIFEMLIHDVRVVDVQTTNQQKIIRRIKKQNEILHSSLKIVKITWSKSVVNNEKNYHHWSRKFTTSSRLIVWSKTIFCMITHRCLANCLSIIAKSSSVSTVKDMITSTKFVDMKNDVSSASSFTTTLRARCRWIKENASTAKTIIRFDFFNARSE